MTVKECHHCGENVAPSLNGKIAKYCSGTCRAAAAEQRRMQRREAALAATTKICSRCKVEKPKTDFRKDGKRLDGLYPYCGDCTRDYYGNKPQQPSGWTSKRQYDKARREALKENPGEYAEYNRANMLWTMYRMTIEDYDRLLVVQDGRCGICQRVLSALEHLGSNGKPERFFAVDHDHSCCPGPKSCGQCIRGLLCRHCNTGLGLFADDPDRLNAALKWVRGPLA